MNTNRPTICRTNPSVFPVRRTDPSGFSLVELLVVITIITVLAAILFPVFAQVREKARQASCLNNEKQLGLAFQQYTSDNDDTYPVSFEKHYWGYGWAGKVMPYVKSAAVFKCPDDTTEATTNTVGGVTYTLSPVSYAYNGTIGIEANYFGSQPYGYGIGGAVSRLSAPSKTVLLLETGKNSVGYPIRADLSTTDEAGGAGVSYSPAFRLLYTTFLLAGSATANSAYVNRFATGYMGGGAGGRSGTFNSNYYGSATGRHSDGANYLLCDGHVKWLRGDQVSTGSVRVGSTICATQETDGQDKSASACGATAAGTGSSELWAATWSPI